MITKTCPKCGAEFAYARTRGHGQRRYCSVTCRTAVATEYLAVQREARYRWEPFPCRHCGRAVDAASTGGRRKTVFCSPACKEAYRSARQKAERALRRTDRLCRACGGPIAPQKKGDAVTCSRQCSVRYQNTVRAERAKLTRSQRPRSPCRVCGSAIDPARRRNVVYCSEACKRVAVAAKYRARHPDAQLSSRFQMKPGEYDALLAAQGGQCAICGATEAGGKGGRFHVDHDHATGTIRGLLCHACNIGIGMLRDDPDVMRAAIRYVERPT